MPHVVLKGQVDLSDLEAGFEAIMERTDDRILKTTGRYRSDDGRTWLLDSLVIEGGVQHPFLARVDTREDGLVVRLHPIPDVEKTDGVKRLLALIAEQLMARAPGLSVGETNLDAYLDGP